MILDYTPIEKYKIDGQEIFVKREDLCCPKDKNAPTFSKIRGLLPHLVKLKSMGYDTVGYTETAISMAGWGVAWASRKIGLRCVIFNPIYKFEKLEKNRPHYFTYLNFHRNQWKFWNAEIVDIPAGRAKVNYYLCKKILETDYPNSVMLQLGLPLKETIDATFNVVNNLLITPRTLIVNVGSGTICAGIIKGLNGSNCNVIGIMGRSGNVRNKRKNILKKVGIIETKLMKNNLKIIDPGWNYTDKSNAECPFPSHPYYDLKAWEWLTENLKNLEPPILFWNIGR